jgi:hypothetical protein
MASVPEPTQSVSTTAARYLWESAVCLAATKARAALPDSNGRIDKAMALVLGGAVEVLDNGHARVTSQHDGTTQYFVVNGACTCPDFERAPAHQCKHRIARGIAVRALQIAKELGQASTPQTGIPAEFLVQIQGKAYVTFQGLLYLARASAPGRLGRSSPVTGSVVIVPRMAWPRFFRSNSARCAASSCKALTCCCCCALRMSVTVAMAFRGSNGARAWAGDTALKITRGSRGIRSSLYA